MAELATFLQFGAGPLVQDETGLTGRFDIVAAGARRSRRRRGLTPLLASQLYGIAPQDAATLAGGLVGLLAAGGLACDLPARRAARLDIVAALHAE